MRELTDRAIRVSSHVYYGEDVVGTLGGASRIQPPSGGDSQVFESAKTIENVGYLGLDSHTAARDSMPFLPRDIHFAKENSTCSGLQLARQHLEKGTFPSPIGSDNAAQLALGDREVNAIDRIHPPESFAHLLGA